MKDRWYPTIFNLSKKSKFTLFNLNAKFIMLFNPHINPVCFYRVRTNPHFINKGNESLEVNTLAQDQTVKPGFKSRPVPFQNLS